MHEHTTNARRNGQTNAASEKKKREEIAHCIRKVERSPQHQPCIMEIKCSMHGHESEHRTSRHGRCNEINMYKTQLPHDGMGCENLILFERTAADVDVFIIACGRIHSSEKCHFSDFFHDAICIFVCIQEQKRRNINKMGIGKEDRLNLLWHCPLYATASDVNSWRQARFLSWHSDRYVLPSLPQTTRWYWWSLSNIFCKIERTQNENNDIITRKIMQNFPILNVKGRCTYHWHIDWRIWNIMSIKSRSYSIFPRGILIVVPMRWLIAANIVLIVSMFAAMSHIAMLNFLCSVVRWRRRRFNAYAILSKSMTILWRRWYDRNDFIFFWHRRIFIKTTFRLDTTAIEYGNLHIGSVRCMPSAIPLFSFVRISVDISTGLLCIMLFCVMLIWFAFWRTNAFWFAATHYASLLWTTFGWTAWICGHQRIKKKKKWWLNWAFYRMIEWVTRNFVRFVYTNRCMSYKRYRHRWPLRKNTHIDSFPFRWNQHRHRAHNSRHA